MSTAAPVTDFSQPVFLNEEDAPSIDTGAGAGIDLNDPSLLSSELATNSDVDAYAVPPPIPDGRYRLKIKQLDVKDSAGQPARYAIKQRKNKDGSPKFLDNGKPDVYAFSALEGQVVDPGGKYDNYKLSDYFVSTMVNKNGGIPVVRILTVLGVKLPDRTTAASLMQLYQDTLAKEPELEVDVAWEGGLSQDDQERWKQASTKYAPSVRGMHRFPMSQDGKTRLPDITVKTVELGEVNLHAQPRIIGYFPLGSGKK